MTVPAGIGLREAVAAIRAELAGAMADGADEDLKFDVGAIQLEFAVDVTSQGGADTGVNVWVLSFSANGGLGISNSHRVSIALQPVNHRTGRQHRISDHEELPPPRPVPVKPS